MTLRDPAELPRVLGVPLSAEQLAAATAPLAPQLIVAGAGTGKTTVMAARVVWLVGSGALQAGQVLGLTFTKKAAAELRQRVRAALSRLPGRAGGDEPEPTVMTYHAFAGQILAEFGALVGLEADAQLLADGQRARLAYATACRPAAEDGLTGSVVSLAGRILTMDDALADLDVATDHLRSHDAALLDDLERSDGPAALRGQMELAAQTRIRLSRLVDQFRAEKAAGEYVDFADTVRLAGELAARTPLVPQRLAARFGVVMLDEYQDTSRAQRRMLQALFSGGHPVTAVGDPCQAIYGWRGASVTNIDEFPRHFRDPDGAAAPVYGLTINRRSGEAVLDAANRISADLRGVHLEVSPLVAPAGSPAAGLCCALLQSFDEEVAWLGREIVAAGSRREWSDIAVLCRTNSQVGVVADHLRDVGVPVHVASKRDMLAAPETEWVTSLLRIMVDPFANPELLHHLAGPRWRIGPRDLAILGRRARDLAMLTVAASSAVDPDVSLLDAVQDPGPADRYGFSAEARQRLIGFLAELDRLGRMRDRPVAEIVVEAVELLSPLLVPPGDGRLPEAVAGLVELAQGFRSLAGGRGLAEFVSYLDDCRRFETAPQIEAPPGGGGVRVMTMHAAKGLEFPVVALPFLADGVFPDNGGNSRWPTSAGAIPPVAPDEPDVGRETGFPSPGFRTADHKAYVAACRAEERLDEDRLAYVAVTRAREFLIASGHWWGATQARPRGPSPYLLHVEAACRAGGGDVAQWCPEPGENPAVARAGGDAVTWPAGVQSDDVAGFAAEVEAAASSVADADRCGILPGPWAKEIDALIDVRHSEGAPAVQPPEVLSVSRLLQWQRDPARFLTDLARPMPTRPSAAAERGTRFHAWVEQRMGQQELFDLSEWLGDVGEAQERREFEELFSRTAFAERQPAAVEYPFVVEEGGLVLTGRIDAVFRCTDDPSFDWEVVDWKTGSLDRADPVQLAVYARAWAATAGCAPQRIRGTFVQLSDGSQRTFTRLPDITAPAAAPGGATAGD